MAAESFRFHPEAALELEEAADWYENEQSGLGAAFLAAVEAKLSRMLETPELWASVRGARRALVNRFPYALVYRVEARGLEVIAVAHLKRRPGYWSKR